MAGKAEDAFHPFYEWLPDRFPIPFIVKMLVAIAAGFLFLASRWLAVGDAIVTDGSWLLGAIITTALICLYYATHTFRAMLQPLNLRLPEGAAKFPARLEYLSDRDFLRGGLFFALLNCGVGWLLDASDGDGWEVATLYLGFFLAGFACGMPVAGIRGVVITLIRYLDCGPKVDYTNPDGCGGFLFLGQALIKFSGVTLLVGVLISIFILKFGWSDQTDTFVDVARAVMWMWIALPFLLSLTILLAPASRANQLLMNHKIQTEVELALELNRAREDLEQVGDNDRREGLRSEIERLGKLRAQLHQMRSWPLNPQAHISFGILFVTNALAAFESIRGLIFKG
jgi:hypothetical protein